LTNRVRQTLIGLVALCALMQPAAAHGSYNDVIRDCAQDGTLDGRYSNGELQQAGDRLPSDLDEYSDCREVIAGAVGRGSGKGRNGGGSAGGGGGGAPSPAKHTARNHDRAHLESVTKDKKKPRVGIAGKTVEPGSGGLYDLPSSENGMPLPLLLALIALGLLAAGGAFYALRRRLPAVANLRLSRISLRRVPLPRFRR
jgi:hypothetical protein